MMLECYCLCVRRKQITPRGTYPSPSQPIPIHALHFRCIRFVIIHSWGHLFSISCDISAIYIWKFIHFHWILTYANHLAHHNDNSHPARGMEKFNSSRSATRFGNVYYYFCVQVKWPMFFATQLGDPYI